MEAKVQIQVLLVCLIIQCQRVVTCCGSPKQPKGKSLKHELDVLTLTKRYNIHSFHSKMKLEPYMRCLLSGHILKKGTDSWVSENRILSTEEGFTEYVHTFSNGIQKQIFSKQFL